ncbi:gamma-glutamyltranspeptidase [Zychaea mexicana]|uniref:gamma-glutamyltranspeptidase n=1 Tax=Zychaea mexicana TaxID=64656 RepID=UPI0022FDF3C5|nr:gamma-glutamyltranspeptidase [Zychaea mexicana]KAI9494950.1 gamma-glutamyltranspeptidase [Zychaea mexicana]
MSPEALPFISRRSVVYGTNGMVASSQPLATQAGIDILKKGGNAADAAISVAAALGVTEPGSTGIGGDFSCLYYDAKTRKISGLNGTGRTPAALTFNHIRETGEIRDSSLPNTSIHAVTVPGAAAAWSDTIEHFGSGKLDIADVLQPAIALAEHGFPASYMASIAWKKKEDLLKKTNNAENNLLIGGIHPPEEGDIVQQLDLARTYKLLAERGKEVFYKGHIADAIIEAIQSRGGLMTHEDLASHTSELVDPISFDYHGWTIWEPPPNSQGITTLIALGIIRALEEENGLDLSKMEHNSAEYLHIIIEVLRLAFADTRYYVTDPQVVPVPTEKLLSKQYLSARAKLVDFESRNDKIEKGYPDRTSNTVYFSVVDDQGNACSVLSSVFAYFGSTIVPDRCGFPLHNRGCSFVLMEDHPNCIGPKKRPYHTLIPTMVTRKTTSSEHELEICFGIMGAFMQPQGQIQLIMNMMHFLANPQHAVDLPRICIAPPESQNETSANSSRQQMTRMFTDVKDSVVYLEKGIAPHVIEQLEAMGHTCIVTEDNSNRSSFGAGQIIRVVRGGDFTGKRALAAGSDPRVDGHAAGLSGFTRLAKL